MSGRTPYPVPLFVGAVLLNCVVAYSFIRPTELAPETVQRGSFHSLNGTVVLAMDPDMWRMMAPDVGIYRGGVLAVPTGRSVVLPLEPGVGYLVRNLSRPVAPYVLLGDARRLAAGHQLDHAGAHPSLRPASSPAEATIVRAPRVLAPTSDGGVGFVPWSARPWAADAEGLAAVSQRCAFAGEARSLAVQRTGNHIALRLGSCTVEASVRTEDGERPVVAVLAGPDVAAVVKSGGTWQVNASGSLRQAARVLAIVALATLVVAAGVGAIGALAVAAVLACLSLWWPFQALLTFALAIPVAAIVGLLRLAYTAVRAPHRMRASLGGLALACGLAAFAYFDTGARDEGARRIAQLCGWDGTHSRAEDRPAACLLTGYSTAADFGVGFGVRGTFDTLDAECPACQGATKRIACPGKSFDFIRDLLCSAHPPVTVGGRIVFLGGGNDDWTWPSESLSVLERGRDGLSALALLFEKIQLTSPREFYPMDLDLRLPEGGVDIDQTTQRTAFEEAAMCAQRRQAQVWLFHDFLASDLEGGRTASRDTLLAMRRKAVETHGGTLIDLLEEVGDRAGVSWFNDVIHLSAVGHREIAMLMCRMMTASATEAARVPPP